ncbi:MAG: hypothetical protein QXJ28_00840 [Candidatus Pacearchaeota archaeon]
MALEQIIKEAREYVESESLLRTFLNEETKYDLGPRQLLGSIVNSIEPTIPADHYLGAGLEILVPTTKEVISKKKKKFLEGSISKEFKEAINEISEDYLFGILLNIPPTADSNTAKKHKAVNNIQNLLKKGEEGIEGYVGLIKDKAFRSLMSIEARTNPQRVYNAMRSYYISLLSEFENEFRKEKEEVDYSKIREYIIENLEKLEPDKRDKVFLSLAPILAEYKSKK